MFALLEVINLGYSLHCLLPGASTAFGSKPETTEELITICCHLYLFFGVCISVFGICISVYVSLWDWCVCAGVCVLILMCILWLYVFACCTASRCEYTHYQNNTSLSTSTNTHETKLQGYHIHRNTHIHTYEPTQSLVKVHMLPLLV